MYVRHLIGFFSLFVLACTPPPVHHFPERPVAEPDDERPLDEQARSADYSVLYVGNSHTSYHDLPGLVGRMVRFRHPDRSYCSHVFCVATLDHALLDPGCRREIESGRWKHVILQAQKISTSGRFDYPRTDGIALGKLARGSGAKVAYFAEWGLKGITGDGPRYERIYQEMADAAQVRVAPVGRAWDLALAKRPELPLHAEDGNHSTTTGAFLSACVIYAQLTGESPRPLADFPYPAVSDEDRKFLAEAADKAVSH